jgi:hypothetical protein
MYSRVDVTVASEQSGLYCFADLIGLGLPSSQTDSWDFVARVEGESFSVCLKCQSRLSGGFERLKGFGITYLVCCKSDILRYCKTGAVTLHN